MKYILACLFSLGIMAGAYAQGDTTQQQQESGMITCMYLDENTIACFSPMEYEMEQQEGFHYGEPHDSLFNEQTQEDSLFQNENEDLMDNEAGARLNEEEEAIRQQEGEPAEPQLDQQGKIEEQENYGAPSTESPENGKKNK